MTERKKLRAAEFAEVVAAERMAMKLIALIEDNQRQIAAHCACICPLNSGGNMLDRMKALLSERRYEDIRTLAAEWRKWQHECEVLVERAGEMKVLIEGFCTFYEETNGRL